MSERLLDAAEVANGLMWLARRAKSLELGLWGECPGTILNPNAGIDTGGGK